MMVNKVDMAPVACGASRRQRRMKEENECIK